MTRPLIVLALLILVAGCGSNGDEPSARGGSRVERCVERLLERAKGEKTAGLERYVRTAYCVPFDKRSLLHEDGTFTIDVLRSGRSASVCAAPRPGEPTQTIPCDDPADPVLDCALLDLIRRAEVQQYLARRQRKGPVRCDDGTPLDELGS